MKVASSLAFNYFVVEGSTTAFFLGFPQEKKENKKIIEVMGSGNIGCIKL